jgi:hypothetical protein
MKTTAAIRQPKANRPPAKQRRRRPAPSTAPTSELRQPRWAAIGNHYIELDLTYDQANARVQELSAKGQQVQQVWVVTNETARRLQESVELALPTAADVKFG